MIRWFLRRFAFVRELEERNRYIEFQAQRLGRDLRNPPSSGNGERLFEELKAALKHFAPVGMSWQIRTWPPSREGRYEVRDIEIELRRLMEPHLHVVRKEGKRG